MSNRHITADFEVLRDPSWWHWALTVPLLAAHVAGIAYAIEAAIVLCAVMSGYYFARIRTVKPFPVQLRLAYLGWLVCGLLPGLHWMQWIALLGTTAMITVGYCLMVRMLKLLPFNRQEPLTLALVWRLFVEDPCAGGLLHSSGVSDAGSAGPCSMLSAGTSSPCSWNDSSSTPERKRHVPIH